MSAYRPAPRAVSHVSDAIEKRIAETWRRTREGLSAASIADCMHVQPRTVVRYRSILRERGELPADPEPMPEQIPQLVHLTVRRRRNGRGRGFDTYVACGADFPVHSRRRSWGIRREITCPDCRKTQEAMAEAA